jgi:2,3-dihydroxybenzoate-AMP ligase/mycobactin salicyl-AMP ligase
MNGFLEGFVPYDEEAAKKYSKHRYWSGLTFGDLLDRAADIHPDKEAFVEGNTRITYGEAREKANKLALSLMDLGIKPRDRVLVQLPNWHEFIYSYFAIQKIGAIVVLLIERYRQHEINHLISLTGATAWIVPFKYKKYDFIPIINDVRNDNPQMQHVITVRGKVDQRGFFSLDQLIDQAALTDENVAKLNDARPDPMEVAHMGPTGGTTGLPKIVPRTHNSLITGITFCSSSWDQNNEEVNLVAGPIGHDLSFSKGFMGSIITLGKIVLLDSTDNKDICEAIEKEKVTAIIWVPTLAQRLLQYEELDKYDLSSLRKMHSAGAASHPELVKAVTEKLRMKFYNGYGATEGMTTITRTIDSLEIICTTVGRPTCPYDTYKVIDMAGNDLPLNKQGELVIKGPGVFTGYYNNPAENMAVFTKDGFFRTGDVATIDDKGYIRLTGRIKEMINRGGESISATEIEKLIATQDGVANVAVIAMPDRIMGERVCAYIQPKPGVQLTFDDIIAHLKGQKASVLHLPERIEFVKSLPMTAAEKIDKKSLREDIENKLKEEG